MFHMFEKINRDETYIIAEMSANHAGKLENALKIVREAAMAGADCVKIQTYTADTITLDCDKEYFKISEGLWAGYKLHDLYSDACTPWEWQERIKQECEANNIDFLSTPFDNTAVDFLNSIGCEAYKIASFELVDIPLIEYAASKGKPMLISCGMGSEEEISDAIDACHRAGNNQIVLLKCCSEYPANWADMNLANIQDMKRKFGVEVGLSDHSLGSLGSIVGVALGASVIEKHICLSRKIKNPDSEFSMEVSEFVEMVQHVRQTELIKGSVRYGPTKGEEKILKFRRSIFAIRDIKAGEKLSKDNIRSIRPSNGMKPKYFSKVIGRTAICDIYFGEPILPEKIDFKKCDNIKTDRLTLRCITRQDAKQIVHWRSNPDIYRYFTFPHQVNLAEHLEWFDKYIINPDRIDFIAQDNNGAEIGVFGIKRNADSMDTVEVSYLLDAEYRGKGYAREAVMCLMDFAKNNWNCNTAIAVVHSENMASIRFIMNMGYKKMHENKNFSVFERII